MSALTIDGIILKKMFIAGGNELIKNKDLINSLNVFPVPDGDTGNNMSLTVEAAILEIINETSDDIEKIARLASKGALKGARGNSGVILSQLFRGFASAFKDKKIANAFELATAISVSSKAAYKAVMKPKEGTILTVSREMGETALEINKSSKDIVFLLEKVVEAGEASLARTIELLPQLKEAGVVDSGGKGLVSFYEGMLSGLISTEDVEFISPVVNKLNQSVNFVNIDTNDIEFMYCTEFFINIKNDNINYNELKKFYNSIGDSLVLVDDEEVIKIHVHTNEPNKALEKGLSLGDLSKIKIENMKEQHTELIRFSSEEIPVGFISVCSGKGIIETFKEYGATEIIEGGQTMNPSTEDILRAIDRVNSNNVVILPNNKNIILAANQAKELSKKNVEVIESVNIPEGLSALLAYIPTDDFNSIVEKMKNNLKEVISGSITFAIRDTKINNIEINKGDFISMCDGEIVSSNDNLNSAIEQLLASMINDETGFLNVFYNDDTSLDNIGFLEKLMSEKYSNIDFEIKEGNQPLYNFIISAE